VDTPYAPSLEAVRGIARAAGAAIIEVERAHRAGDAGALGLRAKGDASPVTAADLAAHRVIVDALRRLTPDVPVLSEEAADVAWATREVWRRFWLVDPLDGTREFLTGNGEYTVNIALVEHHAPRLGVVYAPASGLEYSGIAGVGAWRARGVGAGPEPIRVGGRSVPDAPGAPLRVVGSRSHRGDSLDALLRRRCLSAARPDQRMGHRRGACGAARRRWSCAAAGRLAARLQPQGRPAQPRFRRLR
jgi:3'(2'), 5'-bisphosphate nucleotidase